MAENQTPPVPSTKDNGGNEPFLELEGTSPMLTPPRPPKRSQEAMMQPHQLKTPDRSPAHSRSSSGTFHTAALRSNLMREQRDRDPLFYYEVQKVLGVGSMGSVVLVKKRAAVVGGSARADLRNAFQRERAIKKCGKIPVCGWIARYCLWNPFSSGEEHHARSTRSSSIRDLLNLGSPFQPIHESGRSFDTNESNITDPNKAHNTTSKMLYAMKSIHLSRVTDESFVDELRNEIQILKSLDHPHIVKAIETFEHRNQIFIIMESCSGGDLYTRYAQSDHVHLISPLLFTL